MRRKFNSSPRKLSSCVLFLLVGVVITSINIAFYLYTNSNSGGAGKVAPSQQQHHHVRPLETMPPLAKKDSSSSSDNEQQQESTPPPKKELQCTARRIPTTTTRRATTNNDKKKQHVDRHQYSSMTFDEALAQYVDNIQQHLSEEIEQSSNRFKDYTESKEKERIRLPALSIPAQGKGSKKGGSKHEANADNDDAGAGACDPRDNDYTPDKDACCLQYLSDIRNWDSIAPMTSILSTGRTIKFKVHYKHNNMSALMKISQKKFALEPTSEVMAYHTDRTLEMYRTPPAVWVPFPIAYLAAASTVYDAFYSQWFKLFVLDYQSTRPLQRHCDHYYGKEKYSLLPTKVQKYKCMNVSLQVWMLDVHKTDETHLKPSGAYQRLMTPPLPSPSSSSTDKKNAHSKHHESKDPQNELQKISMSELIKSFIFDFIIGNTDRWFGHNSFVYGACRTCSQEASAEHRCTKPQRYAFIDQGSSFYRRGVPSQSPYAKLENSTLCRFPTSTAKSILRWSDAFSEEGKPLVPRRPTSTFYHNVKRRLPAGVFNLGTNALFRACGSRLNDMAQHIVHCLERYGPKQVFYYEDLS